MIEPEIVLVYIYPVVSLILGIIFKITKPKYPPTGKNPLNSGIFLSSALKSEEHWEYAQRVGSNMLIIVSVITFVIGTVENILYSKDILSPMVYQILSVTSGSIVLIFGCLLLNSKVKNLK
ncbi:MAG: SdpI family protein [Romboutsia sp.]|uniref:SdpI family protein n=1 Tax=Romboutsia sp. TaxID=1965302 RepID=UPI003F410BF8